MLGVIAGDVIGSIYEAGPIKTTDFPLFHPWCRFTDDSVLTIATAHAILSGTPYDDAYRAFGRRYPDAGYGASFMDWLLSAEPRPYNSWGNGSAMRVAPVGFAFDDEEAVLAEAKRSAVVTHGHPDAVAGAQAVALAVLMARTGASKKEIRAGIAHRFGYDLGVTVDRIRPSYEFDVSCRGTVPPAIVAFLDAHDLEHAIRLAVSLGGDSDTLAAITGGIAHAFYGGVPEHIAAAVRERLPEEFLQVLRAFDVAYPVRRRRA